MLMRKMLTALSILFIVFGFYYFLAQFDAKESEPMTHEEHQAMYEEDMKEEKVVEKPKVTSFSYEITGENENELYGVAIDKHGKEIGGGLVLDKASLKEVYSIGEVVNVTFSGADDNIEKVELMTKAEDGTYVPQGFYK